MPEELILSEHTSPVFDFTKLKNAQEMLSCEGVIATLFYKINTNKPLQNNFLKNDFYEKFLLSQIADGTNPKDIFTPFENVILKNFWIWEQIKHTDFNKQQIVIAFIKEWCNSFPEDRQEITKIFLAITQGKTVCNELADIYEELAWYGSLGDYFRYKEINKQYNQKFDEIKNNVLADFSILEQNVGPEIWLENEKVMIRTTLWIAKHKMPLKININTAGLYEIASFESFGILKAKEFITIRDKLGYFKSFEETETYGFKFD